TVPYDSGDNTDAKAHLTVNWLLPEGTDIEVNLSLSLLSHILLATPASPLKKALIDSGLGEDVVGGFEDHLRQTTFSAGLKGIRLDQTAQVETLILDTLTRLAKDGLDSATIAASLNTIEFRLRELNTGSFPRGLALMLEALTSWLYDHDPIAPLAFETPLNAVKVKANAGRYFESLIEKYLLSNPHRGTVILRPDPEAGKRRDAVEQARLAQVKAALSDSELSGIIDTTRELKRRQETPDTPEALATIPSLALSDIDRESKAIPIERTQAAEVPVFYHDLFTNGIVYLDLGFDLHQLPQELLPFAGVFGRLLLEMGTAHEDFVALTQRIGRSTGGIRPSSLTTTIRGTDRSAAWLFLRGKAVASSASALLDIFKDVLLTARLDERERFKQIVLEEKANLEAGLVRGGHQVVNRRLRARFNEANWLSEQMNGIAQLFFLRTLADSIEHEWPAVQQKLEAVRAALINRAGMLANVTLDAQNWAAFKPQLDQFVTALPARARDTVTWARDVWTRPEGLTIPAQVNYVGKGADLFRLGYKLHGSVQVINNYLSTTWLWDKVRVQGGAYGGFCSFDIHSGVYTFLSYRDPNLLATLDNYDATAKFLRDLDLSDTERTKAIIGTIGELDAYQLPDAKGWTSMIRELIGYSQAHRQQFRNEVLATTAQDFKAFAEVLNNVARYGDVVVLGSNDALEQANTQRDNWLDVKKIL
ncbi:MAG: insulinase family protein, partial [Anaerolineae bacterium]